MQTKTLWRPLLGTTIAVATAMALSVASPAIAAPSDSIRTVQADPIQHIVATDASPAAGSTALSSGSESAGPATNLVNANPDSWATSPYMGWSSYGMQVFTGQGAAWINGAQLIAQSDAMHTKLQSAGYNYINVDSGWNNGWDANGRPTPDAALYPQGLNAVINHVHANGQKFGLYWIPGMNPAVYNANLPILNAPGCTTQNVVKQPIANADYWGLNYKIDFGNPCAQKWVTSVADLFASWGVNFVKFDSVTPGSGVGDLSLDARDDVAAWSQALKAHQIWFELSWDLDIKYADYWRSKANGWRIEWDVECYCQNVAMTKWENIARLFPKAASWWSYTGKGSYMDMDSLDVGNGSTDGLTVDERKTATTLWAMEAAPMYTGDDLTALDSYGISLLTNPEVVAINQAAIPARPVSTATNQQVWYSLQPDGSYAVALYNLGGSAQTVSVNWSDLGLSGSATVRDAWAQQDLGTATSTYSVTSVPSHGVRLLKIKPAAGSTVSANDDAQGVLYSGSWAANNGKEVAAASQPLVLNVTNSGGTAATSSGTTSVVSLNDSDPALNYQGSWNLSSGRGLGDYQDDVHWSWTVGDSVSTTFSGTGIKYVTELASDEGTVDIYIDGALQTTANLYSATRQVQQTVYNNQSLPSGVHTLKVVLKTGQFFLTDRFDVTRQNLITPSAARFDKTSPADIPVVLQRDPGELVSVSVNGNVLQNGTDYIKQGSTVTLRQAYLTALSNGTANVTFSFRGDKQNDVHWTTSNGDSVSYTFRGTSVSWLTAQGPDQGNVDVYIDGAKVSTVSAYSSTRLTQRLIVTLGSLTNATHTLKLVKASGNVMRSDVITYTAS